MARIRTIKPEAFESEDLAAVDVTAMVTFFGLLTQADDSGRFRDHPAVIAGRLWALRPEHTPAHVAGDLEQLAEAGLVCRYTGCDGKSWLHIVTWDRHQKINRASDSRLPRCPTHEAAKACGECDRPQCHTQIRAGDSPRQPTPEAHQAPAGTVGGSDSVTAHGVLTRTVPSDSPASTLTVTRATLAQEAEIVATSVPCPPPASPARESAGQGSAAPTEQVAGATFTEGSRSGSRILDPGSSRRGRDAPALGSSQETVLEAADASEWSAKVLMAEYLRACPGGRPPKKVLGHLGKELRSLLDEGYGPDVLRPALERLRAKGLNPSVLPSLVNELLNAGPAPSSSSSPSSASGAGLWASASPAYTPYLNPTEPTGTFGVAL
ncbi:hypothetical protein DEJ51_31035 [Streptomyces venezuelae]|uniref:Uncharacterized protein n=1 Tax=Streptomyces venezuelae TaxID=54571 RepID=A0A5P2DUP3_STRVZ|nr:hypothetical protein [Streptomyces venezuelae]QES58037.1 hypothetical protein DEJ51_31035 [Streptomyces venezuelae]